MDASENRLVQLQNTHFLHNWKKVSGEEGYPRYATIKNEFVALWHKFLDFIRENKLSEIKLNLWEVTYVNHICKGEGWNSFEDFHTIFPCLSGKFSDGFLPVPESVTFKAVFPFPDEKGRLYISADPAIRKSDYAEIIRLTLTARGQITSSMENALDCLDKGHVWIVKGFTDFTSPQSHALWQRKE